MCVIDLQRYVATVNIYIQITIWLIRHLIRMNQNQWFVRINLINITLLKIYSENSLSGHL